MNLWPTAILGHEKVEGKVRIQRSAAEIFQFYRDFTNLPRFLGDVMSIESTGETTTRWTIQGPARLRYQWETELIEEEPNSLIRYRTTSLNGLNTTWSIYFTAVSADETAGTDVREVMEIPLGRIGVMGLSLLGHPPADEIRANLGRLKQLMETGQVTDTSHAVPGKFDGPQAP